MSWEKAISKSERGEVGRVYFINMQVNWDDGREWTRHVPVTLNPDQGSTVEEMLKRAQQIPNKMKADLLSQRYAESRLTGGKAFKVWISDYPAPDSWGHDKQDKPILYDLNGQALKGH